MRYPNRPPNFHPILRANPPYPPCGRTTRRPSPRNIHNYSAHLRFRSVSPLPPRSLDSIHKPLFRNRSTPSKRRHSRDVSLIRPLGILRSIRFTMALAYSHTCWEYMGTRKSLVVCETRTIGGCGESVEEVE